MKIKTLRQAERAARLLAGMSAFVRHEPDALSQEEREQLKANHPTGKYTQNEKWALHARKCTVGIRRNGPFPHNLILGDGDSWDEALEAAAKSESRPSKCR